MTATSEALDAIEGELDGIEEHLDAVVRVSGVKRVGSFLARKEVAVGLGFVAGVAVGGAAVHYLLKNKLKTKYEELADREIAEAKAFYSAVHKKDPSSKTPQAAAEARMGREAVEALRSYQGEVAETPATTEEELDETTGVKLEETQVEAMDVVEEKETGDVNVTVNVFNEGSEEEFLFEIEELKQQNDMPFIITKEQFFESADSGPDYQQHTLTYFDEDDILIDEQDVPIRDTVKVIGEDNLRFGYGSKDKNIVYIRNDDLEGDFEVVLSKRSYQEEVLGFKHSEDTPRIRRFRNDDG